ncbi:MAG: hypothetical protein JST66_04045 [Bacteroidetes bacterium]|nr:hypothetical protein [Bacteroidota bacterium]
MEKNACPFPIAFPETPEAFNALPRTEQLHLLSGDAVLLRSQVPEANYYRIRHYFVRVVIVDFPLQVLGIEAFSNGAPFQLMLQELAA